MAWRNNKNWGSNIPDVPEDVKKQFQDKIDSGTCYVTLSASIIEEERLYGVDHTDEPMNNDFWRDMMQLHDLCGMGVALHETKPVLLVRDVYNNDSEPWNIPLCDLHFATDENIKKVQDTIAEKNRLENLRRDINNMSRTFTDYAQRGKNEAQNILSNLSYIAQMAYATPMPKVVSVSPSAHDKLREFWDVIEVLPVNEADGWCPVLRVTKNNMIMKFNIETGTRIHKSLDGVSVPLGKMCVDIALEKKNTGNLNHWVMDWLVYGTMASSGGLLHPHIQSSDRFHPVHKDLREGAVCTGSYNDALAPLCSTFNAIGLVDLWRDFLTSCSEQGWYGDMFPWLPADIVKQYCVCHRHQWAKDDKKCPLCGHERRT